MPRFTYEAANPEGGIARGVVDAPTRSLAVERIMALGRTPVRVVEEAAAAPASGSPIGGFLPRIFASSDRLAIVRELSSLLGAGLSVERALIVMQGLSRSKRLRTTLAQLLEGLRRGQSMSVAMAVADDIFPETVRKLVAAGEASGRLGDVMHRLARSLTRTKQLRDSALSALLYPALLTIVMFLVLTMIFTVVVPRLEPLFADAGAALPWPTLLLLWASHLFTDYGLLLLLLFVGAIVAVVMTMRRPESQLAFDRWALGSRMLLDLPRRYQAAQFCRNLAMLLDGGLALNRALEATQGAITNRYMRQSVSQMLDAVRQGAGLRSAMERADVFPRLAIEFAGVGEETGRLGPMLDEAANIFDAEVKTRLDQLTGLLLPIVTVVLGLVVAAIMTGVVSGILAANDLAV